MSHQYNKVLSGAAIRVDMLFPASLPPRVDDVMGRLRDDVGMLAAVRTAFSPNPPLDGVTAVSAASLLVVGGPSSAPTFAPGDGPAASSGGGSNDDGDTDVIIVAVVLAVSTTRNRHSPSPLRAVHNVFLFDTALLYFF